MKLVSIPLTGVPPLDGSIRASASGQLIGAPPGDLPPVVIEMDLPTAKFISVAGIPGPPGTPGPPGPAYEGVAFFFGEGPPGTIVGSKPGDKYVDTTNGDIWTLGD